jgi:hypothetical protein
MKAFVLVFSILVVLPVSADLTGNDPAGNGVTEVEIAESDMVKIVTHNGRPADCLAPVAVTRIDGQEQIVPAQGFTIEPGVHTLNGRARIDTTYCKTIRGGNIPGSVPDLEVDFEAGMTYYIGYNHDSLNRDDWRLVVWKIESNLQVNPDLPEIEQR